MAADRKVTVDEKAKTITIVLPLSEPRASKSGKTQLIATTGADRDSRGATYKGNQVSINCSVYYKPTTE